VVQTYFENSKPGLHLLLYIADHILTVTKSSPAFKHSFPSSDVMGSMFIQYILREVISAQTCLNYSDY